MASLDPVVVGTVAAMAVATYATKAGGFWVLGRVDVPERARAGLDALPGGIIVAIVVPGLVEGGPAEWAAAALVVGVAVKTDSFLLALAVGVVAVALFRGAGAAVPG